ncbi:MAG: sulfatase-like hydrolase/transferase [Planctomycetota bacterium]
MLVSLAALVLQAAPVALPPSAGSTAGSEARLLLVDIDDVGYDLLLETPTPTLDWVATHGRSFTRFITSPICSPTRAMVMTGAYPSHPDLLFGGNALANGTYSLPLGPLQPLPALLATQGITSAKVGKWHLSAGGDLRHPNDCGWGSYRGLMKNPGPFSLDYWNFAKVVDGASTRVLDRYMTTDETDDAIEHVRAGVRFVSLSYHAPHQPFHVPPPELHTVAPIQTDRDRARAMLEAVDTEFARLLGEALPAGYTVIVFSDNGTQQSIGGGKGTVFEPGVRVPMWAIGPGVAQGVDDELVSACDLYATVAEFFGVQAGPPYAGPHSRSILDRMGGGSAFRRWAYTERFQGLGADPRGASVVWRRAVRGVRFKLIDIQNGSGEEFYDLWANPDETYDLLQGPPLSPEAAEVLEHFRTVLGRL